MAVKREKDGEKLRIAANARRAANPEKYNIKRREWRKKNPEKLAVENKRLQKYRLDWLRKKRTADPERFREAVRKWREENPDKVRIQRAGYGAVVSEWRKKNPGKYTAQSAKRRSAKLRATPAWADMNAITSIYQRAASLNMTVDHIVPLQGRNVCGLHVEYNLQLLTKLENSRKNNRFIDDDAISVPA